MESNLERTKETQIENYCNQLKAGSLKYMDRTIDISHCSKQVWIITRKNRVLKRKDSVIVKEVTVSEIIKVYLNRIENDMDETDLENALKESAESYF